MVILEARKISKYFGGLAAVKDFDFTIEKGEIVGMIGPNGSGKTTVFNMISGVLRPTSGEILFKGNAITRSKPHDICRMGIARTFQIPQPFTGMSVLENVLVGCIYGKGMRLVEARKKAEDILEFTGLGDKMKLPSASITAQDRKRLELARALTADPEIVLLDEVMAGLTPNEMDFVLDLLIKLHEGGITIFLVEHVMKPVMKLSKRIVVLHHGQKIAEGKPEEIAKNEDVITAYLGERYA